MDKVIGISEHPGYTNRFSQDDPDQVKKEIEASQNRLKESSFGANVCYLCTYRKDDKPWWRRRTDEHYVCTFFPRIEVADPVSGVTKYLEQIPGGSIIGIPMFRIVLMDKPNRRCVDLNPDGKCSTFDLKLKENINSSKPATYGSAREGDL